jgi:hypothetical protein
VQQLVVAAAALHLVVVLAETVLTYLALAQVAVLVVLMVLQELG